VHIDGRVLGEHPGIVHFTIGQRRGIGVAVGDPLYVVHLDARSKRVIVGPREALDTAPADPAGHELAWRPGA
jgi:tRNA-specific 2-thiouridylase